MNTAVFVNKSLLTTLYPNWKKLPKTTRWMLLGKWDQDDSSIYNELSKDGTDKAIKPRQHMALVGAGKALNEKRRNDRKNKRSSTRVETEDGFASFGGGAE